MGISKKVSVSRVKSVRTATAGPAVKEVLMSLEKADSLFIAATEHPVGLEERLRNRAVDLYLQQMENPSESLDDEVMTLLERADSLRKYRISSQSVTELLDSFKEKLA